MGEYLALQTRTRLKSLCNHKLGHHNMFAHTHTQKTTCPYCAERIEIVIDGSVEEQSFIEDCQVCCRPIQFTVYISGDDQVMIDAQGDNESY